MSKKIKPNLASMLRPNSDASAMMKALEGSPGSTASMQPVERPPTAVVSPEHASIALQFDPKTMSTADLLVGTVYELPLSHLSRSDNNARVYYNHGEVEEMAESLATKGQEVPIVGYVKGDKVVIVDGQKRFNACTQGKLTTLKVMMRSAPESEADEYEISRRINVARTTQTAFDDAVRWAQLLERNAYDSQDQLAKRLDVSPATVSKTLGLNRIPAPLRRMMADSPQTATLAVAYEISNIFSKVTEEDAERLEAIAEEVISTVIKKELGRASTIELVRSKMEAPKTRLRGDTVEVKFGENKGAIKVVPSRGEFTMSFRGLKETELEDLRRRIQSMLDGQMSM